MCSVAKVVKARSVKTRRYDPVRDTWQTMAPMPTGRHGLGSAVVHGRIHVISGGPTPGGSFSDLNEVFIPGAFLQLTEMSR